MMTTVHVKLLPLSTIRQWDRNPHKHPDSQIQTLASGMRRFGFTSIPTLATYPGNEEGFVSSGNGRLAALRLLHKQYPSNPPPGIDLGPDGDWLIPVRPMAYPSKGEAESQGLSDNWIATMPGVEDDAALLGNLLRELDAENVDLDGLGKDVDALMAEIQAPEATEPAASDDEAPTVDETAPPDSQPGQVYELGPHRLVCGDSRDAGVWTLLMGQERLQMVWTDPPYGVAYVGKTEDAMTIQNDALKPAELEQFLRDALGIAAAHCKPGASWYVAAPQMVEMFSVFIGVLKELEIAKHILQWVKNPLVMGRSDYHYRHEPIFYGWVPGAAHYFVDERTHDSVLEFNRPTKSTDHPTMKPVELVAYCINNSSKPGWLVGEPFGGSGTTLIAAAQTGRVARVIELDPRYCDVIRRRWTRWAKEHGKPVGSGGLT